MKYKKIVAIIQARVGSTRLPRKVLKEIEGKSVLSHVVDRVKQCKYIDKIVIATSYLEQDTDIEKEANNIGVDCFRGSEEDVLSRYYNVANKTNADIVIRITADCPCIDYKIIDCMIEEFIKKNEIDYMNNTIKETFPRGYDVEIFTIESLNKAYENAEKNYEKEHVTPYIYTHPDKFNISVYKNDIDYSCYRLTLDTEEDFIVISKVYEGLYKANKYFGLQEVIKFMKENSELVKINQYVKQKKLGQ